MRRKGGQRLGGKGFCFITTYLFIFAVTSLIPSPASAQQVVTTFSAGASGDAFNQPKYLVFDKAGNLFVSDSGNHRVQRIDKQTKAVTTIAGTKVPGYTGDGGPAAQAQLDCPAGLAFDPAGNLYIADPCQNVVRKVVPGADGVITGASDEIITSLAGNGTVATCVLASGTASQTPVSAPGVLATDQAGNLFMIAGETLAGSCSRLIQRVEASSGLLTTVAIIGPSAVSPGMAFDNSGNLFTWEFQEEGLMCPPAALTQSADPFAGNPLCQSAFNTPPGLTGSFQPPAMTFDKAGNLYFSNDESACDGGCTGIFKLAPGASGIIGFDSIFSLYAGTLQPGYSGDGGPPLDATFNSPTGLVFDDAGNLFIADSRNNVIRMVSSGPSSPVLNSYPPSLTNQTTATFAFTNSDPTVISFVCTLDGSANACTSPANYSGLSDGSHTFSLVGQTSGGTPSNPVFYTWVVDTVPPPMPSIGSHPADPSGTANATFTFSDTEPGVSFKCSLDGSNAFCAGTTTYAGLADGAHTFAVTATDAAGNQSAPNIFSWTIQTIVPPAPQITSAPAVLSNQSAPSFSFSDAQAGVTFICQLDAAQSAPCTSPAIYVGLLDGIHTFSVIASDAISGRSSTPATFTWTKDTIPPTVSCCGGSATVVIPDPAFFYFSSGSSDVVSFLCSLDGAAFASCTSPVTLSITTPGDHTFAVKGVDAAGNVGDASFGGVHVTYCRCQIPGDYFSPAFNDQITTTSPNFKVRVTYSGDGINLADISLVDAGSGAVVYTLPSAARGWQFSPDQSHFVFLSSLPYPNSPVEATVLDLSTSPAKRILTVSNVGGAIEFSPSGTYLMVVGAAPSPQYSVSVYRVGDVSKGVLVYSTTSSGATASWGFSKASNQAAEASFLFAFASGQDTVTWNVADLATGRQPISQTATLGNAFWLFNPCGNIIALVSNKPGFSEQVDLFSTETGAHLGGTSFPVQNVTLSSTVDKTGNGQEVGTITNPQQTIVIVQDNCGPNTPTGNNVTVAPVCSQNNTSPVTVTFSDVSQQGGTGTTESSTGNAPPGDFQLGNPPVYYDIASSATYSGDITICISYAGITFSGTPRLFHFENDAWVDRTTSFDTLTQTVCGTVTSLSPFALFSEPQPQAPAITSAASATFQAGASAAFTVLTNGSPAPGLSETGALPSGLSFVDNHDGSAVLTGTPVAAGTFNLTLSAANAAGNATQNFTLTVTSLNHPPTANAGATQMVEATSPAGALVTLSGSGSDPDNDPITFTWSEGSITLGTTAQITVTLPIGVHTITLTADDGRGGTGTSTVMITVQDTKPPVFASPANQTLEATSPAGAVATFSATATDIVDGVRPVICSPASGSIFPLGITTVGCISTDLHGNSSTGSFTITVRDTTPPIVTPPLSITVPATEAGGSRGSAWPALAAFLAGATAHDIVDIAPVQLSPTVGSSDANNSTLFPYGTTAVNFLFRDASNNVGVATASVTVILGTIRISSQVAAQGKNADGTYFVDVRLLNTGSGNARKLRVDLIAAVPVSGYGRIAVVSPAFPMTVGIGNLDAGSAQPIHIVLKVPPTVKKFVLAEAGDFANVKGAHELIAVEQTVTP